MKKRYLEAPRVLLKFAREASCYVKGRELAQKLYCLYSQKSSGKYVDSGAIHSYPIPQRAHRGARTYHIPIET